MSRHTRRDFLKSAAIAAGVAAIVPPQQLTAAAKRSATDWVTLGNSGVKVTRMALGTGTNGGRVQRELGQEAFTKLVRHAYDRGIRFFETADAYTEMPTRLGIALKGIPRDSYKLMTKYRLREAANPQENIDRMRRELQTEYFDILLLHCVRTTDWHETFKPLRDHFSDLKAKKVIVAHGASCHGLLPIRQFPNKPWLDVALMRINPEGVKMDNLKDEWNGVGDVNEVVGHIKKVKESGTGVLGMKIMGEGAFTTPERRDASVKFVMKLGTVDSVTIGTKSEAEIDEALALMNKHLNA